MSHSDPIFAEHNILKVEDMFKLQAKIFMFKYTYDKLPRSFTGMFQSLAAGNRTNSYRIEKEISVNLSRFPKTFLPKMWNLLTMQQKKIMSLKCFIRDLRKNVIFSYKGFKCASNVKAYLVSHVVNKVIFSSL